MYKIFLCFRYLRSKVFALFAILGVALCVWMMLVSVSVMTGFLNQIEQAAKGLFGDIVIEPIGERGLGWYDELIADIRKKVPEVAAADPFIHTLGILKVEGDPDYREYVQIAGIRLPDRAKTTDFEEGLFVQGGKASPSFAPPLEDVIRHVEQYQLQMREILEREFADQLARLTPQERKAALRNWLSGWRYLLQLKEMSAEQKNLLERLHLKEMSAEQKNLLKRMSNAGQMQSDALHNLRKAVKYRDKLQLLEKELQQARKRGATVEEIEGLQETIEKITDITRINPPDRRTILGLGISGLSLRTDRGEIVRYLVPGYRIILLVVPLGERFSASGIQTNTRKFTVIDDYQSGVHSIDKKFVYLPFDTLQLLNNMGAEWSDEQPPRLITPRRCSQIHIKVRGEGLSEKDLRGVAGKIRGVWLDFEKRYPDAAPRDVGIETWRQRQAGVVGPIEKQRTLVIIIMAIMSIVAVALIFVILYTIVMQKTREIGVLKAVGASSGGVAALFFGFGAIVGLIGAVLGTIGGYFTVLHINDIQDWVAGVFGYRVWSADMFMFALIPNEVDWTMAVFILIGSILAGLVGALLPAIRAARMQPVEALRYE